MSPEPLTLGALAVAALGAAAAKASEAAAKKIGAMTTEGSANRIKEFLAKRFSGKKAAEASLETLLENPEDKTEREQLAVRIEAMAKSDPAFAKELRALIGDEAEPKGDTIQQVATAKDQSVVIQIGKQINKS